MMGVRFAIALVVLGVVSAQEKPSIGIDWSLANAVYGKIMGLLGLGQIHVFEDPNDSERVNAYGENRYDHGWHHDKGHHHHHGHHGGHHEDWHKKMHMKMKEAHACHEQCGSDAACHTKCPKPWAPLVKACQDFPAIQKCHSTCKDEACDKCPKFEVEWMNKKFAKNPEKAAKMAEQKCPMMLKAHACYQACSPEDMECHHKCHGENHHHGGWHHHGDHHDDEHHKHGHHHGDDHAGDDHHHKHHRHDGDHQGNHYQHWEKMQNAMKKAMMCHATCGKDAECHKKCPKPFAVFVKACEDFPAIQKCRTECKDAECTDNCPKFEKEWMNKKMAKNPERVMKMGAEKCPMVLKTHACHQACTPGDFECHHKCPKMFPCKKGKWGGHNKEEFLQQRPQKEDMQETQPILI